MNVLLGGVNKMSVFVTDLDGQVWARDMACFVQNDNRVHYLSCSAATTNTPPQILSASMDRMVRQIYVPSVSDIPFSLCF